jgi:hypothetical protein
MRATGALPLPSLRVIETLMLNWLPLRAPLEKAQTEAA